MPMDNLLASLVLSLGFWWGLSRICAGLGRWRYIPVALVTISMAVMVCAAWQYQRVVGAELTLGPVIYVFQEPGNALDLISVGFSWIWGAGLLVLIATWTWALTTWRGPTRVLTRRLSAAAVVIFLLSAVVIPFEVRINELPDLSDSAMARLARRTVSVVSKPTAVLLPTLPRNLVEPQAPVPGPNILIIVNESLRRDHMHVFGYERANTPHLDAFFAQHAAQIYDFPHAFSTAASTLFSWTSLLTGRYLVQSRETLGEVSLPWHYARAVGKSSFFVSPQNWTWMGMKDFFLTFDPPDYYADATAFDSPVVNDTGVDDLIAAQAAIDRLSVYAQDDTPFLGILQTNATHFPFMHEESAPWPTTSVRNRYDSAIGNVDRVFGKVIEGLDESELLDDTIIIYTADHAEFMYGETDASALDVGSRTASCHPVLTHIPFFIYVPAKWEAQIGVEELRANTQRVVSNVDVTPTLLDLWGMAGIDPSDGSVPPMDGQSLLSPISEERSVWCFNLPVWSALPTAALGVYSRDRMAYMRSEFDEILYMNSSDWVDKSQWRRWDSPTEADRVWLSEALGAYELLEPYMRKIQTANPTLMEGLSQGPRPAAP